MIITKTPFRVSFFGGGTDYPTYVEQHGGAVIASTIDKYCYITCRHLPPFFNHKHRIVYSNIENVSKVNEIVHPAVRGVFEWMNVEESNYGLEIHHDGDLPARSGLGSSSSFTVGLIHALTALNGKLISKHKLAEDAIHVEQKVIGENVGSQDQVCATYGGLNKIEFSKNGMFDVVPLLLDKERKKILNSHMMLFFTGVSRFSSEVAGSKIANIASKQKELNAMFEMVDEASLILCNKNTTINDFGKLLHESWLIKKSLSDKVTTPLIEEIYSVARKAGAVGGKVLGAGGGGFMLFFAPPEIHERIKIALKKLIYVPFDFEDSGSRVMLYQPDGF